jgi:hypothetical protein
VYYCVVRMKTRTKVLLTLIAIVLILNVAFDAIMHNEYSLRAFVGGFIITLIDVVMSIIILCFIISGIYGLVRRIYARRSESAN